MDILSLKNISFKNILTNISLSIPQNGFITLSGPSGSGKSTILKICARMLTKSTGELIFEGEDAAKIPVDKYRMQVSYCFQQPVLFGDTVADNLDFPFEIRKEPVKRQHEIELLERVNLSSSYLEKPIADLSGGEKQRVALIRNLLFKPKVLLLDEVTAGLDVDKFLQKIWRNRYRRDARHRRITPSRTNYFFLISIMEVDCHTYAKKRMIRN